MLRALRLKNKRINKKMFNYKKLVFLSVLVIAAMIASVFLINSYFGQTDQPKAAIIDQLGSSHLDDNIRFSNLTFVETAKELLYERFTSIDYYSDNATVENYKKLPFMNYKVIVWRAHSALDLTSNYIAIATSQKYSKDNYLDNEHLTLCNITGDPDLYYGITPKFIEETMIGRFENTVLILLSCNGLKEGYAKTASTFEEKGVRAVVSWDGWVSSFDNDNAGTILLQQLIRENSTVEEAVEKIPPASSEYGTSQMTFFPKPEAANYRIPEYLEKDSASNVELVIMSILRKMQLNLG